MKLPAYMLKKYGTARNYKKEKRRQLREVKRALNSFRFGMAYCPAYKEVERAIDEIDAALEKVSVQNWGR